MIKTVEKEAIIIYLIMWVFDYVNIWSNIWKSIYQVTNHVINDLKSCKKYKCWKREGKGER